MTGVLLAVPGADFVLHNSLFLVAHFHNVIIGGVLFGCLAGMSLLVPQGRSASRLQRSSGARSRSGAGSSASIVAFIPLYVLGFMGMTRRMNHYADAGLAGRG